MVNLYLGSDHDQQIRSLATTGDLNGYAHEAQSPSTLFSGFSHRLTWLPGLDPPFQGVYRMSPILRQRHD